MQQVDAAAYADIMKATGIFFYANCPNTKTILKSLLCEAHDRIMV
ncbi:hypothetical protein YDYSG_05780 [Paenibacillus tyrfis]|nr:hypothetical protein YDYSG_05780 [Paenibacillus tyrfis]GMX65357.1 hypothetical protein Elgi_46270 [Paenibacillus elgii]